MPGTAGTLFTKAFLDPRTGSDVYIASRLMNEHDLLPIELARLCGVSADTIRHYEKVGVLPPANRGANGYRRYARDTVDRVLLVRRALAIGFSLEELARILRQRDEGGAPCRGVRNLAAEKLVELERRIAEMTALRDELTEVVNEWDARLAATRDGQPALLLESFAKERGNEHEESTPAARRRLQPRSDRRRAG
jgi:DNA-binding transcriptional MerR regulator